MTRARYLKKLGVKHLRRAGKALDMTHYPRFSRNAYTDARPRIRIHGLVIARTYTHNGKLYEVGKDGAHRRVRGVEP